MVVTSTIFTKNWRAYFHIDEVVQALKSQGCVILDCEVMPLTHEQCDIHYPFLVDKPFYWSTKRLFDRCPSIFLRVRGELDVILHIIGEKTNPKECNKDSFRVKYGLHIGDNGYHRSGNEKEAKDDDERFWGKNGFITLYRKNPGRFITTTRMLHKVMLAQSEIKVVLRAQNQDMDVITQIKMAFELQGYTVVSGQSHNLTEEEAISILTDLRGNAPDQEVAELIDGQSYVFDLHKDNAREEILQLLPCPIDRENFISCSQKLTELFGDNLNKSLMAWF